MSVGQPLEVVLKITSTITLLFHNISENLSLKTRNQVRVTGSISKNPVIYLALIYYKEEEKD